MFNEASLAEIEEAAALKEQEWHSAATLQIKSLQQALMSKNKMYEDLSEKFNSLKEDFKYNLKLLQERDRELEIMDGVEKKMKVNECKFLSDLSDLHINIDNLKERLLQEKQLKEDIEVCYKQKFSKQQTQFEIFRTSKNNELEEMVSELRKVKQNYEQKVKYLEGELEAQKIDLMHQFEGLMKNQEKETKKKTDEAHSECMAREIKNKLLRKENECLQEKEKEHKVALQDAEDKCKELDSKLKRAEWEIADVSSLKNGRILELEAEVKSLQLSMKRTKDDFEERRSQLDKEIRRKQANLLASKQADLDREKNFEDKILKLQNENETSKLETQRALWDANEMKKKLEEESLVWKKEAMELKERLERCALEMDRSSVSKDAEIVMLKKREETLKVENHKLRENLEKYQDDLTKLREIDGTKQNAQYLYEGHVIDSTALQMKGPPSKLDGSQDRMVRKLHHEVDRLKDLFKSASHDRDVAFDILQKHGLTSQYKSSLQFKPSHDAEDPPDRDWQNLMQQNEQLKSVIKQMREDLQELQYGNTTSTPRGDSSEHDAYTASIEKELLELKKDKRRLQDQLNGIKSSNLPPSGEKTQTLIQPEISVNHPKIQQHINSLNKTIGSLEGEKVDLRVQLQKLQAQLDHKMAVSLQHEQDSKSFSLKVQELEHALATTKQRSEEDIRELKSRLANMTLQLAASQREADEYYRGGIHNNMRATELSEKVSQMTMDIAASSPWLSNHTQAMAMRDLQKEVVLLRRKLAHPHQQVVTSSDQLVDDGSTVALLRRKLKEAGDRIISLKKEKSMLLESGNKMRMELLKMKQNDDEQRIKKNYEEGDDIRREEEGKLEKMEKLQYQLTKQELAFAQRRSLPCSDTSSSEQPSLDDANIVTSSTPTKEVLHPTMMSSIDDASLKDVWKMLDQAPSSPSIADAETAPVTTFGVKKMGQPITNRQLEKKTVRRPIVTSKKKKKPQLKIRNYNIKDDDVSRDNTARR